MAYVNRENLIQLLAHENSNIEAGRQYYSAIYQKVMNMPTADVAEVKWIDVNERLPEKEGMYLIFSPYTNKEGGIVYCNRFLTKGNPIFPPNSFESISKVTHWMPLPEPPSGAKTDGGKEE